MKRILVVEDEKSIQNIIKAFLKNNNFDNKNNNNRNNNCCNNRNNNCNNNCNNSCDCNCCSDDSNNTVNFANGVSARINVIPNGNNNGETGCISGCYRRRR